MLSTLDADQQLLINFSPDALMKLEFGALIVEAKLVRICTTKFLEAPRDFKDTGTSMSLVALLSTTESPVQAT